MTSLCILNTCTIICIHLNLFNVYLVWTVEFVKQLCHTQGSSDILWRTSGGLCISGVFCWGFGLVASGVFVACVRLLNTMFAFI